MRVSNKYLSILIFSRLLNFIECDIYSSFQEASAVLTFQHAITTTGLYDQIFIKILTALNCPVIIHIHCTIPDIIKICNHAEKVDKLLMLADHVVTLNKLSCSYALDNGCTRVSIASNFGNGSVFPEILINVN